MNSLFKTFFWPSALIALIVLVKLFEENFDHRFINYGVLPKSISGLKGILFSVLIHADWKHLFNNSVPMFVLTSSLIHFYRSISREVFLWLWFISGLLLWVIGRPNFHIGASGLVYALSSFLFFSGLLRKHTKLMAISLFVVFLYGGMIWGIFPLEQHISWEGHLSGGIAGILLAFWFRREGPPNQIYQYEIDELLEEQEEDDHNIY